MPKFKIDNREAVAYTIFKYTRISRAVSLAIIAEFEQLVPALTKVLARKYRSPRRVRKATGGLEG